MPLFVNKNVVCENAYDKNGANDVRFMRGVAEIQARAFAGWARLQHIDFHHECNVRVIGEYAFHGTALTMFLAPKTLQVIRCGAFANCAALRDVVLNEGLIELGAAGPKYQGQPAGVFQNSGLVQIALPRTLRRASPNTFAGCQKLRAVYSQPAPGFNIWSCVQNYALLNGDEAQKSAFVDRVTKAMKDAWRKKPHRPAHVEDEGTPIVPKPQVGQIPAQSA